MKAAAYTKRAIEVAKCAISLEELNDWWRLEADHRKDLGIADGSPEWKAIVEACAIRKADLKVMARAA